MSRRPAWRHTNLHALRENLSLIQARSGGASILGVVKADAYGHGVVPVARALENGGVAGLVVASIEEARELREAGLRCPVLVLGGGFEASSEAFEELASLRLTPVLSSLQQVRRAVGQESLRGGVHLLVDTGMARLGVGIDEVAEAVEVLKVAELEVEGVATHFSESERFRSEATATQIDRFLPCMDRVLGAFPRAQIHVANSAAALHLVAESPADLRKLLSGPGTVLVRPGGALYGVDLSEFRVGEPDGGGCELSGPESQTECEGSSSRELGLTRPVLSIHGRILQTRTIPEGSAVGYGGIWVASRESRIGVLPLGYADGMPGVLREGAYVGWRDLRLPIVGAVSMDVVTVDLTGTHAGAGDVVTVLGSVPATPGEGASSGASRDDSARGAERGLHDGGRTFGRGVELQGGPSLADWVGWSGRKPYELLCGWSRRLRLEVSEA